MKTIQISDETCEFLVDLAKKLETQDNRATANPMYYAIREDIESYDVKIGNEDGYRWYNAYDDIVCDSMEEAFESECICQGIRAMDGVTDEHLLSAYTLNSDGHDAEGEELLDYYGWDKIPVAKKERFSNAFLTEDAAKEHIEINGHNLKEPSVFLFHAYRNRELDMVIKSILEIGKAASMTAAEKTDVIVQEFKKVFVEQVAAQSSKSKKEKEMTESEVIEQLVMRM